MWKVPGPSAVDVVCHEKGDDAAQSPPQPVTERSELAPAVASALGAACFQAFQTMSNLSLPQNCSKSDARGFETNPVGPDEADNLMRPALLWYQAKVLYMVNARQGYESGKAPVMQNSSILKITSKFSVICIISNVLVCDAL
jgi:hypothetical protein